MTKENLKLTGIAASLLLVNGVSAEAQKDKKPNIVFVFVDQLRHDRVGYAGDMRAHTPNLDKLAAQSMNFRNAVSVSPVPAPMRASLLTGKYTSSTGMVINYVEAAKNQKEPFALFLSIGVPHDPWTQKNVPAKWYNFYRDSIFGYPETWSDTPDRCMDRFKEPVRWLNFYKKNLPEFQRVIYLCNLPGSLDRW